MLENLEVSFSPTDQQIGEIKQWLSKESYGTADGFFCNWNIIISSCKKHQLAIIYLNKKVLGFTTWNINSKHTATIDIVEVHPTYRHKGVGRKLMAELFNFFNGLNILAIDLQCTSRSSEAFWKSLGYKDMPNSSDNYDPIGPRNKKLYKIIVPHIEGRTGVESNEIIEIWDSEPYLNREKPSTWKWNLDFIDETRRLVSRLIYPVDYDWRIRWSVNNKVIKDSKIKYFVKDTDFVPFIIIEEMPIMDSSFFLSHHGGE